MTLQAPLIKGEKKPETCEQQLRRMCKDIAQDITDAKQQDYVDQPRKEITASEWMEGTYDIRYYVDREKRFMGAEIMSLEAARLSG